MTVHVTLAEAARQLAELVARVGEGEEVLIDEGGRTVAVLVASPATEAKSPAPRKRRLGVWSHLNLDIGDGILLEPDVDLERLAGEPVWPRS